MRTVRLSEKKTSSRYFILLQDSGKVVESLAGWVGAYRWQRSKGSVLGNGASIETVRDSWSELMNFKDGDFPQSHMEATMDVMMRLNQAKSGVNILPLNSMLKSESNTF